MAKSNRKLPSLTKQDIERFWSKVNKAIGQGPQGTCWEWSAARVKGYGVFKVSRKADNLRVDIKAHRVAYLLIYGVDLGDNLGCHTCDNPPCCRPEHIFKGTHKDNGQDSANKGRRPSGDKHHWRTKPETLTFKGDDHWTRKDIVRARKQIALIPHAKGERQHSAKMTAEKVLNTRQEHAEGRTIYRLAQKHKVCWSTIHKIVRRVTWKHC